MTDQMCLEWHCIMDKNIKEQKYFPLIVNNLEYVIYKRLTDLQIHGLATKQDHQV